MDQNRLLIAIVISIGILIGFELLAPHQAVRQVTPALIAASVAPGVSTDNEAAGPNGPRVPITAPRVEGSIELVGAKFDDLVLRDYHETVDPKSPQVRVLESRGAEPAYLQYGWLADTPGTAVPDNNTQWTADGANLSPTTPVTLSWNNGQGLVFALKIAIDDNYMFSVTQTVRNTGTKPITLRPWSRVRRGYTPSVASLGGQDALLGEFGGRLQEMTYKSAKSDAEKADGIAYQADSTGGWSGISDKYWLTAVIPDQAVAVTTQFRDLTLPSGDGWQVDYTATNGQTVAPGAAIDFASQAFAGAKKVQLLDRYEAANNIPNFSKAIDFGWFYFVSKPIFYALDWLYGKIGNFGLAIMVLTVGVKILFFPLANRSYVSMNKMRLLAPKMQAIRERFKDDPTQMQAETMALYKAEKVNPASGCLPLVVQLPVMIALNTDLRNSIEMRHAAFFGWIHDLSAPDPTNLFNLFGLLHFDPTTYASWALVGAWPIIMGALMYFSQRLNPPMPDPVQARMMQFMPLVFTFMMARYSAGLVIYWSWNNLLSLGQQWLITRPSRIAASTPAKS